MDWLQCEWSFCEAVTSELVTFQTHVFVGQDHKLWQDFIMRVLDTSIPVSKHCEWKSNVNINYYSLQFHAYNVISCRPWETHDIATSLFVMLCEVFDEL